MAVGSLTLSESGQSWVTYPENPEAKTGAIDNTENFPLKNNL
jgi:hypothetical protein